MTIGPIIINIFIIIEPSIYNTATIAITLIVYRYIVIKLKNPSFLNEGLSNRIATLCEKKTNNCTMKLHSICLRDLSRPEIG